MNASTRFLKTFLPAAALACAAFAAAAPARAAGPAPAAAASARAASAVVPSGPVPVYGYRIVHAYPHDANAFTEGLFYMDGFLYESTGLTGRSSVRKVKLETGQVVDRTELPPDFFGEGITGWGTGLIGLTWQSHIGYVLRLDGFSTVAQFGYPGEGWGLTHNEKELVMSDGTPDIRFLDPETQRESHRIHVTADGKPVDRLNELEWVRGEIYANVWQTDRIARIDPKTGRVVGWIDLKGLLPKQDFVPGHTDVLNGIAYDAARKRLFVTGKLWPKLFEIQLVKQETPAR
jgi:glutaminyl-peptide cyclotransferase